MQRIVFDECVECQFCFLWIFKEHQSIKSPFSEMWPNYKCQFKRLTSPRLARAFGTDTSHRSPTWMALASSSSAASCSAFSASSFFISSSLYLPSLLRCRKALTVSVRVAYWSALSSNFSTWAVSSKRPLLRPRERETLEHKKLRSQFWGTWEWISPNATLEKL